MFQLSGSIKVDFRFLTYGGGTPGMGRRGGGGLYHSEVRGDEICVRVVQLYYVMLIGF